MPLIDTDTLAKELHAVAVARRAYQRAQQARETFADGDLMDTLARLDRAYLSYTEALAALGERVASMVDLEPPPMNLTIIETK